MNLQPRETWAPRDQEQIRGMRQPLWNVSPWPNEPLRDRKGYALQGWSGAQLRLRHLEALCTRQKISVYPSLGVEALHRRMRAFPQRLPMILARSAGSWQHDECRHSYLHRRNSLRAGLASWMKSADPRRATSQAILNIQGHKHAIGVMPILTKRVAFHKTKGRVKGPCWIEVGPGAGL
jgi:hypothetical protein